MNRRLTLVFLGFFLILLGVLGNSDALALTATGSPVTCTNNTGIGTAGWTNPGQAAALDATYATTSVDGTTSNYLYCTGYGLAIPAGATINGITVNVTRKSSATGSGGSHDAAVRLIKAGVIGTTDGSTATTYPTSDATEAHGSGSTLWGTTWTYTDINAANFGVAFAATKPNNGGAAQTISVDYIQVVVTYTLSPPTVVKSFSPASIAAGENSTQTITITNPNAVPISGLAFTDNYPTNLGNASTPALINNCGGTATASAGAGSLSLSGGGLAAGSSCSLTVSVTSATVASYLNSTGAITSTNAPNGPAASATLTVIPPVSAVNSTVVASPTAVAADNVSISTIAVTLRSSSGSVVPGKTVTLAAGSGSSIITTLSGITDAGGIATFTVRDGVSEGPISYTATDTTDAVTVMQTAQVTFTQTTCFGDAFIGNNVAPDAYWSVGKASGGFTPQLVNNRLRLTDTGTAEGTWVTLNKYFPGAGNKIVVQFADYAYGGTGADGVTVVLSDASIAPSTGAFGGSLGYAPKSNPGSDCTVSGGCVGFSGGWMGVGLDEYGNFQNPTEGRYGGPGFVPNSVSIRGSGSGMSGYRFITGTSSLVPGIITGASQPHLYRLTIDHGDSVHAWVSVERDAAGGGSGYQTILGATGCGMTVTSACLDIKDAGYSQNPLPANWRLSFTGANGVSTDIHEISSFSVCTTNNIVTPTLDHIEIDHGGQGCTGAGNPASVTVRACANTACSALYLGSVTVSLTATPSVGTTWSSNPVTFSGGSAMVTLADTNTGTLTLGSSAVSPAAANATTCYNGSAYSCSFTFSACVFDVVEVGKSSFSPIYTKLAGTAFSLDVVSLGGPKKATAVAIVDASTGSVCSAYGALVGGGTTTAIPANPFSRNTFAFNYPNAIANARIRVTQAGPVYSCSSDNFAIRPRAYALTSNATQTGTSGTPIFKAGTDGFTLTATALSSYAGTPKLNSSLLSTVLPYLGALSTASFPAAIAGVATASGFAYGEVGNFTFGTDTVYDDSFTAVDSVKPNPECTPDFSNAANANGMYGCMFGNTSALKVGRFVPDHFTTTPMTAQGCATGGFTYSGQPFSSVRIDALNAAAGNTRNYSTATGFSKTVTLCGAKGDDGSYNCSGSPAWSVGNATILPTSFLAGNGYYSGATPIISFTAIPTAPSALSVRAHDSDSVSSSGKTEITTNLYSGLLRLTSYTGSATAALQIPVQALYWGGSSWIINNHDSCTVIPSASIALSNYLDSTGAPTGCWTTTGSIPGPLSGGHGNIILTTPASTCTGTVGPGSVSVALNLGSSTADTACLPSHPVTTGANEAYLRGRNGNCAASNSYAADPSATATFGIYTPESNKIIHLRELY